MSEQPQTSTFPADNPWSAVIGPFYRFAETCQLLHLTASELEQWVADHHILQIMTTDGHRIFPAWQFRRRQMLRGWSKVLAAFLAINADEDPWMIASWARTSTDYLEEMPLIAWLQTGRSIPRAVRAAEVVACRWSH